MLVTSFFVMWMLVFLWSGCWWLYVGDNFRVSIDDRISILVTSFGCSCLTLMLKDRGYWWQNRPKPSPEFLVLARCGPEISKMFWSWCGEVLKFVDPCYGHWMKFNWFDILNFYSLNIILLNQLMILQAIRFAVRNWPVRVSNSVRIFQLIIWAIVKWVCHY